MWSIRFLQKLGFFRALHLNSFQHLVWKQTNYDSAQRNTHVEGLCTYTTNCLSLSSEILGKKHTLTFTFKNHMTLWYISRNILRTQQVCPNFLNYDTLNCNICNSCTKQRCNTLCGNWCKIPPWRSIKLVVRWEKYTNVLRHYTERMILQWNKLKL